MKPESPDFSFKLSRRELLKLGGIGFGTILLGSCSKPPEPLPTASPRPTARPTPEARPTLASTPTRTPEPTPEPLRLIESIKRPIPEIADITIEKYAVKFLNITSGVQEPYRKRLQEWLRKPDDYYNFFFGHPFKGKFSSYHDIHQGSIEIQNGLSFLGYDKVRPGHAPEFFYFDGENLQFYTNIIASSLGLNKALNQDKEILGWSRADVFTKSSLTSNGRFIYNVSNSDSAREKDPYAIIIADVPNGMKTVIRAKNLIQNNCPYDGLSSHLTLGEKTRLMLLFKHYCAGEDRSSTPRDSFYWQGLYWEGLYLFNFDDWLMQFRMDRINGLASIRISENGDRLYIHAENTLYNTETGKKTFIPWQDRSTGQIEASDNLHFIAQVVRRGLEVYTPEGLFEIYSPLLPGSDMNQPYSPILRVLDNGTIYTLLRHDYRFEDGTYKLSETVVGRKLR